MYKKYLIIFILNILILFNNSQTFAKYAFRHTLDAATINTKGNYYLITYTEIGDSDQKVEKLYKGDDHDTNGDKLRKWIINKRATLESIKIEDNSGDIRDCSFLFGGTSEVAVCLYIKKIDLSEFNTENVTDMSFMFYDCIRLIDLNISNLNTKNVKDMSYMFFYCQSIKSLDLRSFNTNNVTDMTSMFSVCNNAKEIKVSTKWNLNNAITLDMFKECGVSSTSLYN